MIGSTASRAQIFKGVSWSVLESLGGQTISFVVFLIMARLLTPSDFGIVAIANIFVMIATFFIFQGLGQAIIQFEDLDEDHLDTVFWINLSAGLCFFGLTLILSRSFATWFQTERLASILVGLSPVFLLAALTDVQNNLLARKMMFRTLAIRTLLSYLLGGIVGIYMAFQGAGAWSLVWQQLTVWSVNLLLLWLNSTWRPRFRFSRTRAARLCHFGVQVVWIDLVGLMHRRADQLFVGKVLGPTVLGFYSVGARVSMLVSEVLAKSISRVSLSALSRIQHQASRFADALCEVIEMQGIVIFPAAIGLAMVAPDIMLICFGEKWMAAVPVMQALLLACPFEALSGAHHAALVSQGKPGWASLLTTVHAGTNLLVFVIAIRWGAVAIAIAFSVRSLILYPLELLALRKALAFPIARFLKPVLFPIGATSLMALIIFWVRQEYLATDLAVLNLLVCAVLGAAVYLLVLIVGNRSLFQKLYHLVLRPAAINLPEP